MENEAVDKSVKVNPCEAARQWLEFEKLLQRKCIKLPEGVPERVSMESCNNFVASSVESVKKKCFGYGNPD
jgi:hypothetical protein